MTLQARDQADDRGGTLSLLDKLNVTALVREVFSRKALLVKVAAVGVGLGLASAVFGTINGAPANAVVTLREDGDFAALDVSDVFSLTRRQALDKLGRELSRRTNLLQAITRFQASDQNLPVTALISAYFLNPERLELNMRRVDDNERMEPGGQNLQIEITGTHPQVAMRLLNELFQVVNERTIADATRERQNAMENEELKLRFELVSIQPQKRNRDLLKAELDTLVREALARRKAQMIQLKEALAVADAIGQTKPSLPNVVMAESGLLNGGGVDSRSVPLFLLGSEALNEQIRLLKARTSDDHEDPRILEVRRDLELLDRPGDGRVPHLRGDREPISEEYVLKTQRLFALRSLMMEPLRPFRLLDVIRDPSRGRYSDLMHVLSNVLRSVMLLLVLAVLWISGRFVLGTVGAASEGKA